MKYDKIFINTEMRKRAIGARLDHCNMGHPNDKIFGEALDNGTYEGSIYTSADLKNAEILLGKCKGCIEAKLTAPVETKANISRSTQIGSTLYMDVVRLVSKTTGGNIEVVFGCEETSDFLNMAGCKTKGYEDVLNSVIKIVREYNQYGHQVKKIIFDNEAIFVSIGDALREIGITPKYTPAQRHNKLIERKIREIKDKCRAIRASQRYKIPDHLKGELLARSIFCINATPNSKTGPNKTPYLIVTGKKPIIPTFEFGQIGITNGRRSDAPDQRSEYGIFLNNMYNSKSHLKVYVPHRKNVYSKRTFIPTTSYPASWKLTPRMTSIEEMTEIIDANDENMSNEDVILMNSSDPETVANVNKMRMEMNRIMKENNDTNSNSVIRYNSLSKDTDNDDDVPDIVNDEEEDIVTNDNIVNNDDVEQDVLDDNVLHQDKEEIPNTRVLRSESKKVRIRGSTNVLPPRANAMKHVRYENYYKMDIRIMEKELMKDDYDQVEYTSVDMVNAFRMSVRQAENDKDETRSRSATQAVIDEIDNIMGQDVLDPVHYNSLTAEQKKEVIHAFMFLKEKHLGDGSFEKWKDRLVAGADYISDRLVGETFAPTANYISVMTTIALAAIEKLKLRTYDVKGAYLIPEVNKDDPPIYIRLDRDMTTRFVDRYPHLAELVDAKGSIVMRLKKYLYRSSQAARHWNIHLRDTLISKGFRQCDGDPCVFQRGVGRNRIRLVVYVDDLLVSGNEQALDQFDREFHRSYECTGHKGDSISYLGLHIIRKENGDYIVSAPNTRDELISKFQTT